MASHEYLRCRACGDMATCQSWTLSERERTSHDEGRADANWTETTGQCDDCLECHGPDDDCRPEAEQDEAEARAEAEYRTWDRGEL